MNLSRCKRRTLIDIYYLYPYKKNIPFKEGTIPMPFIKHSECTNTKLSVDWFEWQIIIKCYLKKLKEYLEEGNSIELGSNTGEFRLARVKSKRFLDFKKSKEQNKQVYRTISDADGHLIIPSWNRKKKLIKYSGFWQIKLNQTWLREMYVKCSKNYTQIYKLKSI